MNVEQLDGLDQSHAIAGWRIRRIGSRNGVMLAASIASLAAASSLVRVIALS